MRALRLESRVAWGAVLAGTLVALAAFFLLGSLTAAIEITMTTGTGTWFGRSVFLLSIVPMFVGGWTASRLAAGETSGEALVHGVVLWSATALLLLYMAMNGILMFGTSTVLGQPGDQAETFAPVGAGEAWWGFAGLLLSMISAVAGSLLGAPDSAGIRDRLVRRRHPPQTEASGAPAH